MPAIGEAPFLNVAGPDSGVDSLIEERLARAARRRIEIEKGGRMQSRGLLASAFTTVQIRPSRMDFYQLYTITTCLAMACSSRHPASCEHASETVTEALPDPPLRVLRVLACESIRWTPGIRQSDAIDPTDKIFCKARALVRFPLSGDMGCRPYDVGCRGKPGRSPCGMLLSRNLFGSWFPPSVGRAGGPSGRPAVLMSGRYSWKTRTTTRRAGLRRKGGTHETQTP